MNMRQGGQLGESGEYRMGRRRVECFHVRSSEGGSPHLCRLRTASVGPEEQASIMYWGIHDIWGPANLVALMVTELDDTSPLIQDVHRDCVWATHGCPSRDLVEDVH
jgi:hypothetical protein